MRADDLLTLEYPQFGRRVDRLFEDLRDSPAAVAYFVQDPVNILRRLVFEGSPQPRPSALSQGNRILYALLGNERFMAGVRTMQNDIEQDARDLAEQESIADFGEALRYHTVRMDRSALYDRLAVLMAESMDREIAYALTMRDAADGPNAEGAGVAARETQWEPGDLFYHEVAVVTVAVALAFVVVTMIDATPLVPRTPVVNREDMLAIANNLGGRLAERARTVRDDGSLTRSDRHRRL